ncbi:hypothetical protein, partial [Maribacter flavus]|uniref:hypothetical protein n=1 Tax=Maribacter flavus TaxID=1658664 RepID=UPI003D32AC0B
DFNDKFIRRTNKQLNITATAHPTRDITIDLVADRQNSSSIQENYDLEALLHNRTGLQNQLGSFSISTMMIGTAFGKSDEFDSATFEQFKENRLT